MGVLNLSQNNIFFLLYLLCIFKYIFSFRFALCAVIVLKCITVKEHIGKKLKFILFMLQPSRITKLFYTV